MDVPLHPGDLLDGRYRLEAELGSGGFATVFLGTRVNDGARVALKVLAPGRTGYDHATRARFVREAAALEALDHPHIVQFIDHGQGDDGLLYLVFELLDGEDLSELLHRREKLSVQEATTVLQQLLSALDAAHRAGIIHRDLKPENVRVVATAPLRIKLFDFGIARPTEDGSPGVTRTGELLGTPRYMSPEQLTNEPLTPASDVYSAGIVGLELLWGRDAMHGNRWSDQLDRLQSGYVFGVGGHEGSSMALLRVLAKMTARAPADRFQSARAAAAALDDDRTDAHPPSAPRSRSAGTIVAAIAAGVLLFVLAAVLADDDPEPVAPPPRGDAHALLNTTVEEKRQPRSRSRVTSSDVGDATDVWNATFGGCGDASMLEQDAPHFVHLPDPYDPNRRHPLLVLLRDDRVAAGEWVRAGGLGDLADEHGIVLIVPDPAEAKENPLNRLIPGTALDSWRTDNALAPGAIEQAVSATIMLYCIDPGRIFLLGHGHGGSAAYTTSCRPWLAGAATYAHHFHFGFNCPDQRPLPFLLMFPNANGHHPFDGSPPECEGDPRLDYPEIVDLWQRRNRSRGNGGEVAAEGATCERFEGDASFQTCVVEGGRPWPGVPRAPLFTECDGVPAPHFPAAQVSWSFFDSLKPVPQDDVIASLPGLR